METALNDTDLADAMLVYRIAQSETDALAALYDRHAQTIYQLIARIVREPTSAEDVLQETFWQVWRKAHEFRGDGTVAAWLYRIARNKSLDHLRHQRAQHSTTMATAAPDVWFALPATGGTVEQIFQRRWNRQQVRQALARIPDDQRLCLELAYFEEMSQQQIAVHTRTPLGTVKTRVRMGLEKLARILRAAGYRADDIDP